MKPAQVQYLRVRKDLSASDSPAIGARAPGNDIVQQFPRYHDTILPTRGIQYCVERDSNKLLRFSITKSILN